MKNQDSPIRMADPDWIKRGQWDLNVESLERFFIVIGAGVDANVKVLSGWFEKPVAQKIPDWLLIELVDFLDENKKNFPVPVEIRSKYNKLTKVTQKPKVKKIERRRVLSKKNPQDLPSRVKKLFAQIDHKTAKALNVPKTPSIGGASPGRALKPAVFNPKSVDIDNDGWHQEGTTAAWFGAGLNNPILVGIKESLEALSDEDRASAYQTMTSLGNFGNFAGAPLPEDSTPEADLSWLAGKMTLARQGGPPRPAWGGKEEFPLESQWLLGRNEARRRKGIQQEILPIPEIEQLDEGEILATLDKAAEARKQRRAVADSKMRVNAGDSISDDALQAAKSFDAEDYPQDESVETLPEAEWIEKNFGERPETPEYRSDWTPEEIEAYNESVEAKMTWLADSYDAYILYTRDQEKLRDAALLEAVSKIYDFEFTGNDGKKYSTKVESAVNSAISSSTIMKGKFYDDAGKEVGVFERTFHFGEGIVTHDLLVLNPEVRGSQISGIFNSRNEIAYRAMGFHTIGAGAASGAQFNGSTHWPKVGFDWADGDERSGFLSAVEDAVVEFAVALKDDPDSLPMVAKIIENEDSSTTVVNIPIFASREEAESIAMLLTLSRSQDFDAEDRLTAGDFVNWSGAEAFFQQRGVSVELTRSIGGQEEVADVPEVVEPEVPADTPKLPNRLTMEMFSRELEAAIAEIPEKKLKNIYVRDLIGSLRDRAESAFQFAKGERLKDRELIPGEPPDGASFGEDLNFLVDAVLSGDLGMRSLSERQSMSFTAPEWLHARRSETHRKEIFDSAGGRDELYDFGTKEGDLLNVDVDKVVTLPLDPFVDDDRIKESERELVDLKEKMIEKLGRPGAEWRHISFIDSNGEEVTMVRGIDFNKEQEIKAAIAHGIGSVMGSELSVEEMIAMIALIRQGWENRDQITSESLDFFVGVFGGAGNDRLVMAPNGRVEFAGGFPSFRDDYPEISTKSPEYKQLMGEYIADQLLGAWASSSNRGIALGIQSAVERVFSQKDGVRSFKTSNDDPAIENVFDEFVKAQYLITQTMFKDAGITKITTHRGMTWYASKGDPLNTDAVGQNALLVIEDAEVALQPVSSTAFNRQIAYGFASAQPRDSLSVVVHSDTPVERILSSGFTGIGCLEEDELTLIGGGDTRFNLSASAGERVDYVKGSAVEVVVDRFRSGEKIEFSVAERLEKAGYSEKEIEKIQDYMSRKNSKEFPSINEIQLILSDNESEIKKSRANIFDAIL